MNNCPLSLIIIVHSQKTKRICQCQVEAQIKSLDLKARVSADLVIHAPSSTRLQPRHAEWWRVQISLVLDTLTLSWEQQRGPLFSFQTTLSWIAQPCNQDFQSNIYVFILKSDNDYFEKQYNSLSFPLLLSFYHNYILNSNFYSKQKCLYFIHFPTIFHLQCQRHCVIFSAIVGCQPFYVHSAFKHGSGWRVMEPVKSARLLAMLKEGEARFTTHHFTHRILGEC